MRATTAMVLPHQMNGLGRDVIAWLHVSSPQPFVPAVMDL